MEEFELNGTRNGNPGTLIARAEFINHKEDPCVSIIPNGSLAVRRPEFEAFIEWGQAWLKENPVKVDTWLSIHAGGYTELCEEKDVPSNPGLSTQIACIPISYHIGEGLEEENE